MLSELGARAPNSMGVVLLRCKNCSAPLDASGQEQTVRCRYCMYVQRVVDARAFLEQLTSKVESWVRQALPVGFDAGRSEVIDPIARHSIFINSVRPRLSTEFSEYRFNVSQLLSQQLFVLPFTMSPEHLASNSPQDVFLFQEKVQRVRPLAIDEESKNMVSDADELAIAYAHLLNNVSLMRENQPERYYFMSQNFEAALAAVSAESRTFPAMSDRLQGLLNIAKATDLAINGKFGDARKLANAGLDSLESSKNRASQRFESAIMVPALEKEISLARSVGHVIDAAEHDPSGNGGETIAYIERLLSLLKNLEAVPYPQWQTGFRDVTRYEEILRNVSSIRRAQTGEGTIRIATGDGNALFPFWAVDMPYTFQTGALWMTRGVEVSEAILVAATFPIENAATSGADPASVITDVFRARGKVGILQAISGRETAISGGGPIRDVIAYSAATSAGGRRVIPPLSTPTEATMLAQWYIDQARRMMPTIDKKLRLSSPRVQGLLFVPGTWDYRGVQVLSWLGDLRPRSVGNIHILSNIAM